MSEQPLIHDFLHPIVASMKVVSDVPSDHDSVLIKFPYIGDGIEPGIPGKWIQVWLVATRVGDSRLEQLLVRVEKILSDRMRPPFARDGAACLLAYIALHANDVERRLRLLADYVRPTPTRLLQYLIIDSLSHQEIAEIHLGEFRVGQFDDEKFLYEVGRVGSGGWEQQARGSRGLACISRSFDAIATPLHFLPNRGRSMDDRLVHGIVDNFFQHHAASAWVEFWQRLKDSQLVASALMTHYVDVDLVRATCMQGAQMLTVFSRIGDSRQGWVSPNLGRTVVQLPNADAFRGLQKLVAEDFAFTGWGSSEVSTTTRRFCEMLYRARSLFAMSGITSEEAESDAFMRHVIALEMLFSDAAGARDSVSGRSAVVTHLALGVDFAMLKRDLSKLYGVRSDFVHKGVPVERVHLELVEKVTSVTTEWLLRLDKKSPIGWSDVLKQVDFIRSAIEGAHDPAAALDLLAIPRERLLTSVLGGCG